MQNSPENKMSFLDHLEELRWHILRSVISILIFTIIVFSAKKIVFHHIILAPSRPDFFTYRLLCKIAEIVHSSILCITELPFTIQSRIMTGQFTMHILSSLVIGFICAFPYVFWEIWRFVKPALYSNEKKIASGAVFFVSLLFITGILFGYYIVAPLSINFLANYQLDPSIVNQFDITSYIKTLSMLVMACGIMFQLPIMVYFLSKAGIITPTIMRKYRRHALIGTLVISAIITPPDVISQLLISVPLFLLYAASIFISRMVVKEEMTKI